MGLFIFFLYSINASRRIMGTLIPYISIVTESSMLVPQDSRCQYHTKDGLRRRIGQQIHLLSETEFYMFEGCQLSI